MEQVLSDGLWKALRDLASKAKLKRAAIAYFTRNHLLLGKGDVLVVDASDKVIQCQATSAALLGQLFDAGVAIYCYQGLHAKIALLDDIAVIGSANSSKHSADRLVEASVISDSPLLVARVQQLIKSWVQPRRALTRTDIDRLIALPKDPPRFEPSTTSKQSGKTAARAQATWITPVRELAEDAHPDEERAEIAGEAIAARSKFSAGREITFIRIGSTTSKLAQGLEPGDLVIQIWKPLGSKRLRVCPPQTVLYIRREKNCTRVYIEETPTKVKALPFGKFEAAAKKAGLRRPIRKTSNRLLHPDDAEKLRFAWKEASNLS